MDRIGIISENSAFAMEAVPFKVRTPSWAPSSLESPFAMTKIWNSKSSKSRVLLPKENVYVMAKDNHLLGFKLQNQGMHQGISKIQDRKNGLKLKVYAGNK